MLFFVQKYQSNPNYIQIHDDEVSKSINNNLSESINQSYQSYEIILPEGRTTTHLTHAPSSRTYLTPIPKLVLELAELQPRDTPVSSLGLT